MVNRAVKQDFPTGWGVYRLRRVYKCFPASAQRALAGCRPFPLNFSLVWRADLYMDGPAADLREVHVGVPVLLYEGEQVGLEHGAGREEGQADG